MQYRCYTNTYVVVKQQLDFKAKHLDRDDDDDDGTATVVR
jgi:hypothetical protein